jgi:hypothetical protein
MKKLKNKMQFSLILEIKLRRFITTRRWIKSETHIFRRGINCRKKIHHLKKERLIKSKINTKR